MYTMRGIGQVHHFLKSIQIIAMKIICDKFEMICNEMIMLLYNVKRTCIYTNTRVIQNRD